MEAIEKAGMDRAGRKLKPHSFRHTLNSLLIEGEKSPEKILKLHVDPVTGLLPFQCRDIGYALDILHASIRSFSKVMMGCYNAFIKNE